jgi:hypothetical protein
LIKTLLHQKKPSVKQGLPVNKKTLSIAVFVSALLVLAVGKTQIVGVGRANPFPPVYNWTDPPVLSIHSPVNETYVNRVLLNFTVIKPEWWAGTPGINGHDQTFDGVTYYIDDRYYASVGEVDKNLSSPFNYFVYLTNLTDGPHSLAVHAYGTGSVWDQYGLCEYSPSVESSSVVYFTLDTSIPSVSILSLENKTYYSANVTLTFDVNEPTSEMNYCLDGLNITLAGNTTLTQLSYGTHSLTVYATDIAGNTGASKTINFTIAREPQPFLIILVIASITTVVVCIGLIVYFKKRKR